MKPQCYCNKILNRDRLVIHLMGCPEHYEYKEYVALKWYKRIFRLNPYKLYLRYHVGLY